MERMDSRGEPRLWLIGLTLPLALGVATMLGVLSAPAPPLESTGRAVEFGIALLFGVFLILCGAVATVAIVFWNKSQVPRSSYHELIATLPDEADEDVEESDPESRL